MIVSIISFKYYLWMLLYCLNIIVNITSLGALDISMNTTLKHYDSQGLNEKLKLMVETLKELFSKKLLGHEIYTSMIPWSTKYFFKNL